MQGNSIFTSAESHKTGFNIMPSYKKARNRKGGGLASKASVVWKQRMLEGG